MTQFKIYLEELLDNEEPDSMIIEAKFNTLPSKKEEQLKNSNLKKANPQKVFVAYGHDESLLTEVEVLLRRIGLNPIILKNEANEGNTITEKIEGLTQEISYGIILYSGCDLGKDKDNGELKKRARQNVVF